MDSIYIAGPTASGKSSVALLLAEKIGGEIVSVDSMQVYHGMDIGTAKPIPQERARVRHHLIDVAEVNETFDVARFVRLAKEARREIIGRGKVPIFCGGTGLYFNALVFGVGHSLASDSKLRAELETIALPELLDELAKADPETFARIDRANPRRVIRAIEVIRSTGQPYSIQRSSWKGKMTGVWFALDRERADLDHRINVRVDSMFASGLVEETRELLNRGLAENRTALQAIGYRQVVEHLNGERDLRTTVDLVKQKTRQFAKRQGTWFRNQLELNWIKVERDATAEDIADRILLRLPSG